MTKNKFDRLVRIMCDYQEEHEFPKDNIWITDRNKKEDELVNSVGALEDAYREAVYSAQNLGFVQGMHFAYDIMEMTENGKNKELLENLINIIEQEK